MEQLSFAFAALVGCSHAFEADHLAAVSSMSMRRTSLLSAMKDGVYWGLGHTSTLLLIGGLMIGGRWLIAQTVFSYLEAMVGLMLIGLGLFRFWRSRQDHVHVDEAHQHKVAYGVGAIHGLAGSGVLIVLLLQQWTDLWTCMAYLLLFGLGSMIGMLLAAGVFSMPFSKRWSAWPRVQRILVLASAVFCVVLGGMIVYENIIA